MVKRGRPALGDAKRKQFGVRLSPKDRERFEQVAKDEGTSVGAELEQYALWQLAYMENTDAETRALLGKILDNIKAIQNEARGRWYTTRKAWAATAEMMAHVIDEQNPDRPDDDEVVAAARAIANEATANRLEIVQQLSTLGVSVRNDPKPLLLGALRTGGLFGTPAAPSVGRSSREWETAAINALPDDIKAKAEPLFQELLKADEAADNAWAAWSDTMRPYWEAEEEGRRIGQRFGPKPRGLGIGSLINAPIPPPRLPHESDVD